MKRQALELTWLKGKGRSGLPKVHGSCWQPGRTAAITADEGPPAWGQREAGRAGLGVAVRLAIRWSRACEAQPEEEMRPRWGEDRPEDKRCRTTSGDRRGTRKEAEAEWTRAVEHDKPKNGRSPSRQVEEDKHLVSLKSERERNAVRCQLYADSEIRHTRSSLWNGNS